MKEKLSNLIDVKSIVTIALTILFIILSVKGAIDGNAVVQIFTTVIAFYFGTKYQQTQSDLSNNKEDKK
jgi:hypothetical protein